MFIHCPFHTYKDLQKPVSDLSEVFFFVLYWGFFSYGFAIEWGFMSKRVSGRFYIQKNLRITWLDGFSPKLGHHMGYIYVLRFWSYAGFSILWFILHFGTMLVGTAFHRFHGGGRCSYRFFPKNFFWELFKKLFFEDDVHGLCQLQNESASIAIAYLDCKNLRSILRWNGMNYEMSISSGCLQVKTHSQSGLFS